MIRPSSRRSGLIPFACVVDEIWTFSWHLCDFIFQAKFKKIWFQPYLAHSRQPTLALARWQSYSGDSNVNWPSLIAASVELVRERHRTHSYEYRTPAQLEVIVTASESHQDAAAWIDLIAESRRSECAFNGSLLWMRCLGRTLKQFRNSLIFLLSVFPSPSSRWHSVTHDRDFTQNALSFHFAITRWSFDSFKVT